MCENVAKGLIDSTSEDGKVQIKPDTKNAEVQFDHFFPLLGIYYLYFKTINPLSCSL